MFKKIDTSYQRQEHLAHYLAHPCTFSMTVSIDISKLYTRLKEKQLKLYPVQIYLLARIIQKIPEFRMDKVNNEYGFWSALHPSYTILNKETMTFSSIWTPYTEDFKTFYRTCTQDIQLYSTCSELFPMADSPQNLFNVSSLPWISFDSFNLNMPMSQEYLLPIFTLGKLTKKNNKVTLPLAIQVHHASCDGYHVGQFIQYLEKLIHSCDTWLTSES